jgi:type I restriction enzyme S subunit
MNTGRYDESENKALPAGVEPAPELEVKVGDVLMSRSNTTELVGAVGRVHRTQGRILLCDKLYRIDLNETLLDPDFAVYLLRSHAARQQIEHPCPPCLGA